MIKEFLMWAVSGPGEFYLSFSLVAGLLIIPILLIEKWVSKKDK